MKKKGARDRPAKEKLEAKIRIAVCNASMSAGGGRNPRSPTQDKTGPLGQQNTVEPKDQKKK